MQDTRTYTYIGRRGTDIGDAKRYRVVGSSAAGEGWWWIIKRQESNGDSDDVLGTYGFVDGGRVGREWVDGGEKVHGVGCPSISL